MKKELTRLEYSAHSAALTLQVLEKRLANKENLELAKAAYLNVCKAQGVEPDLNNEIEVFMTWLRAHGFPKPLSNLCVRVGFKLDEDHWVYKHPTAEDLMAMLHKKPAHDPLDQIQINLNDEEVVFRDAYIEAAAQQAMALLENI